MQTHENMCVLTDSKFKLAAQPQLFPIEGSARCIRKEAFDTVQLMAHIVKLQIAGTDRLHPTTYRAMFVLKTQNNDGINVFNVCYKQLMTHYRT